MGRADYFREGDHNRICDRCGHKRKASDTKKDWQGLVLCLDCYESRHPQDFKHAITDRQRVPWSRPEPKVIFTLVNRLIRPGAARIGLTGHPLRLRFNLPIGRATLLYQGFPVDIEVTYIDDISAIYSDETGHSYTDGS